MTEKLPTLVGTPNQTEWAGRIRAEALEAIATTINAGESLHQAEGGWNRGIGSGTLGRVDAAGRAELVRIITAAATRHTEAGWWIRHRDMPAGYVLDELTDAELAAIAAITRTDQKTH